MTAPINYCGNETYPINPTAIPVGPRTEDSDASGVSVRNIDHVHFDEEEEVETESGSGSEVTD